MTDKKITLRYILAIIIAVIFTWIIHEFAHWLTSELLGYDTIMRLNGTSSTNGENPTDWHKIFISASGPIITILQGLIVFIILKSRNWNKYLYAFLFTAFYMRLLAGLMNLINPNDEGRISAFLEIGTFTLPIIVSGLLFFMVYKISKKYNLNWKFQLSTTLIVMVASSILILSDQFLVIRIL
jgi:high-affinity Fe2+/Pb2+ permease